LQINPLINVGVIIYGYRVVEERNIPFTENTKELQELVRNMPYMKLDKGMHDYYLIILCIHEM